MVLTATGEILTNNHVVAGATRIMVTVVSSGRSYTASVVGTDAANDVAVLQLKGASGLTVIPVGNSDQVTEGDAIAAIGNAGGQGGTPSVSTGTVVGLDRQITASDENGSSAETLTGMIQVDANVVPGDSGGPLASAEGKVIGMDTAASAGRSQMDASTTEGFAIPINRALKIAAQLEARGGNSSSSSGSSSSGSSSGSSAQGFLGVQVESSGSGAAVVGVQSASPAASAGLAAGDTIVALGSTSVQSADDLVTALAAHGPGEKVTVQWVTSSGGQAHATVTLQ